MINLFYYILICFILYCYMSYFIILKDLNRVHIIILEVYYIRVYNSKMTSFLIIINFIFWIVLNITLLINFF